jgi:hypothetical protein
MYAMDGMGWGFANGILKDGYSHESGRMDGWMGWDDTI